MYGHIPEHEQGPVHPPTFHPRPDGAVDEEVHRILVDNRDRADGSRGPFDFYFDVQDIGLPVLRHVISITMKYCAIPKCADEDYILLYLCRGGQDIISTDQACPYPSMALFYDSQILPTGRHENLERLPDLAFRPPL